MLNFPNVLHHQQIYAIIKNNLTNNKQQETQKMKKFLSMALVVVMTLALFATVPITAEAKTFKKTGGFYTFLSKKNDSNNKFYSYAKKSTFKGNKFTTYSSMHYTKPGNAYSTKIYKPAKRTFVISSKCKFYKANSKGQKKITKKALKKLALPLDKTAPSTRTMIWEIKGGKVVKLVVSQY